MSGFSFPVSRPSGCALVIGSAAGRSFALDTLRELGYSFTEFDDPYAAMAELCQRPLFYRAAVLALGSLYREELLIIPVIKRRFSHVEVWLSQAEGRTAALAEATQLGADGVLTPDGFRRFASAVPTPPATAAARAASPSPTPPAGPPPSPAASAPPSSSRQEMIESGSSLPDASFMEHDGGGIEEPVLTADELRALLQDPPTRPQGREG